MNLVTRFLICGLMVLELASCGTSRPDSAALPTIGFASQETISHACRERTVHRSGTSGFEILPDGEESYLARLAMVEAAQRTLDVQYYIWKDDVAGTVFADRLLAAADRGVRVRLLLDMAVDAQKEVSSAALAAHPNIQVGFFNPMTELKGIFLGNPIPVVGEIDRIQSRMHNKLMVADSTIVIGGGRNLGDTYFGIHRHRNMRDLDFIAVGPVVRDSTKSFDLFWRSPLTRIDDQAKVTDRERKELQKLRDHIARKKRSLARRNGVPFPTSLSRAESLKVLRQMSGRMTWAEYEFVSDPPERMLRQTRTTSPVSRQVENALRNARSEVVMHAAYFIPQKDTLELLRQISARGVGVQVLTNSLASIDGLAAMAGIANRRSDVLDTGIGLYELDSRAPSRRDYIRVKRLTPMGMHTKGIVVDDRVSFIGSYNMDPRSKYINTETGVIIQSAALASRLKSYLLEDLQPTHCWHITRTSKGSILWSGQRPDGRSKVHHTDPHAPLSRRVGYWFYRLLPWEDFL
jgi:putative cardiolipin synthase